MRSNQFRLPARGSGLRTVTRLRDPVSETVAPKGPLVAFAPMGASRRFLARLGLITAGAAAWRIWYIVGPVTDRAALHGYIAHLEALGLELLELRRLPAGDGSGGHGCPACGRPADGPLLTGTATGSRS